MGSRTETTCRAPRSALPDTGQWAREVVTVSAAPGGGAGSACERTAALHPPAPTVHGTLDLRCRGRTARTTIAVQLGLPGGGDAAPGGWPCPRLGPGAFELRGLPPGIDLELILADDDPSASDPVALPLRLAEGEDRALGTVTVEVW